MKLKALLYLFVGILGIVATSCGGEEPPKENHALQLYQESAAHLQNVFQTASEIELGIFNLDSAAVGNNINTLETSVDEAIAYWESGTPIVDSSNAFKLACLNWVSYYGLSTDTYQLAFDTATVDSMTETREQYIRGLLGEIANQDAEFKAKYEAERDSLLHRNNIVLN